jgi:hypothetical protein
VRERERETEVVDVARRDATTEATDVCTRASARRREGAVRVGERDKKDTNEVAAAVACTSQQAPPITSN